MMKQEKRWNGYLISILVLSSLLLLFNLPDAAGSCNSVELCQEELHKIENRLRSLKKQMQGVDSQLDTRLAKHQEAMLRRKLQEHERSIKNDTIELNNLTRQFGIPSSGWDQLPADEKLNRQIALNQAAVDYLIMVAMRMQRVEDSKDKDALAAIVDTLQKFESNLQSANSTKLHALLESRIEKDDD
jgi:archaellum component FlaC